MYTDCTVPPELYLYTFIFINKFSLNRTIFSVDPILISQPHLFQEHLWPGLAKKSFTLGG